ncbi:hypothetical protein F8388_020837 [Cannabis sativa]|uniref:Uncharacterized protein n=1 Tax=Cannabis sativa TaxID=3483 RepID=A0A7J6FMX6_CANSA|nr:hypothetical protein F8388_020727 [Cannabis sativa]KAF4371110.1 hypothetical protein F8388_020837 [Cannabis sativa]
MKVEQVFPMNSGIGKASYANNSSLQKTVISKVKASVEESALEIYCNKLPKCMRIADLGCSSGPNALTVTSYILDVIMAQMISTNKNKPLTTFQVFLNDLPGNDFNTVFNQWLPTFHEKYLKNNNNEKLGKKPLCFVMAMPGSFYGRLFPNDFIHFFHSSYSLHWLSKVPSGLVGETGEALNKGNIYITKRSPNSVVKAYLNQFQEDFTSFLRCRSDEIVSDGSMGIIEEKSVDNFNMPVYCPTAKEVTKIIEDEGSFKLKKLQVYQLPWDTGFNYDNNINVDVNDDDDKYNRGKYVSDYMRAVMEPIFEKQFGESVMDDYFERFTHKIIESMAKENWQYINLVISLTKESSRLN